MSQDRVCSQSPTQIGMCVFNCRYFRAVHILLFRCSNLLLKQFRFGSGFLHGRSLPFPHEDSSNLYAGAHYLPMGPQVLNGVGSEISDIELGSIGENLGVVVPQDMRQALLAEIFLPLSIDECDI